LQPTIYLPARSEKFKNMSIHSNTSKSQLITVAIIFIALMIGIFLFIDVLIPFILGFLFAYLLDPVIIYMTKMKRLNKIFSITLVLLTFFTAFLLFFYYVIPIFLIQMQGVLTKLDIQNYLLKITNLDAAIESLKIKYPILAEGLKDSIGNVSSLFLKASNQIFSNIIHSARALLNLATLMLITPILTFYFAFDMKKIQDTFKDLLPKYYKKELLVLFKEMNDTLGKFLKGQLSVSIVMCIYHSIALLSLGVDYAIALGAFAGLSLFIPYIGIIFSFILSSIIIYMQFKTFIMIVYLGIIYICGHTVEGIFITPKLIGKSINLHPLWIILGLFLGGSLFGVFGVLFAIPLTAVIAVLIRFILKLYKRSKLYKY
jgi:predicted PurR-regulated permease PerM